MRLCDEVGGRLHRKHCRGGGGDAFLAACWMTGAVCVLCVWGIELRGLSLLTHTEPYA